VSNDFLRVCRSGDYTAAYALMTKDYRSAHSYSEFTNDMIMDIGDPLGGGRSDWTVDPDVNVELRGWNRALVSPFGSRFLGMRCVLGCCYELEKGPTGWRFTGHWVIIQD